MAKHFDTGPSALPRLLTCPGSRRLVKDLPDTAGAAAHDGSDTHELIAKAWTLDLDAADLIGQTLPNQGLVDAARAERAQQALDHYRSIPGVPYLETWVDLTDLAGEPSGGTADFYSVDGTTAHVRDYKDGFDPVEPDSPQMLAYAAGVVAALRKAHQPVAAVTVGVIQPKVYSEPQVASFSYEALSHWVETVYTPGIAATRDPDAPRVPGEKQCKWCRAKSVCPELQQHALAEIAATPSDFQALEQPPAPADLGSDFLATVVLKAPLIRQWLDAVEIEVKGRMEKGEAIPGLKLARGRKGNRQWADGQESAVAQILREDLGLAPETIFKMTLLSPAQVLKLPAVKGREDLFAPLITQSEGAICLAPASSKKEALLPSAGSDFVNS